MGDSNVSRQPDMSRISRLAEEIRSGRFGQPAPAGSGRGLVVVAGGALMFTNAWVLLHVLRQVLHSRLPVELWYFGQAEISPAMAALLEPLDVRLVDATPLISDTGAVVRDGWQLKAFALVHSRFAEVLLLDADQVPIADPAACFEWPEYAGTGAVFWPDLVDLRSSNAIWRLLGLEPRRAISFESGQILVDRRRHGTALGAALRINEAAEDVYQLIYGDKDTYLLAWELCGAPYALVPHRPYGDERMMVQRDFDGSALFQHRTNAKWQLGAEPRKLFGFVHEEACLAALAELGSRWSGRVFNPPDRPAEARAAEAELVRAGPFVLDIRGEPERRIRFGPHAELEEGSATDRRHWWIGGSDGALRLLISSGGRPGYVLERDKDGSWRGERRGPPAVKISLHPQQAGDVAAEPAAPGLVDELLRAGGVFGGHGSHWRRLADALGLIAAVLPGVRERLLQLAGEQSDPEIGERLNILAASLAETPPSGKVGQGFELARHYVPFGSSW
jgi:hypothetical protein